MTCSMKMFARMFTISAAGVLSGALCLAAQFSADFVEVRGPKTTAGKLYMKDGKVRREFTQGKTSIMISRPDKDVIWDVNLANKTYLELPGVGGMPTSISEIQAALKGLGELKLVGEETVNGYPCDKYAFTYHDKSMGMMYQWIAKKFQLAIKMETQGSPAKMSSEFKNIKEEPVPDSLFELPSGYTRISLNK